MDRVSRVLDRLVAATVEGLGVIALLRSSLEKLGGLQGLLAGRGGGQPVLN
jgi:hypothetical protein